MLSSNIKQIMRDKKKTIREVSSETGLSTRTLHRATKDETIGGCQLNTLAKIGAALGVKTKKLYEEPEEGKAK